jgi:chromosome segregation ATPase
VEDDGPVTKSTPDAQAQGAEMKQKIEELEEQVEELESEVTQLEDDEDRSAIRVPAYRALLADLDCLFGLKHLPFALQLSLDAFGDLL